MQSFRRRPLSTQRGRGAMEGRAVEFGRWLVANAFHTTWDLLTPENIAQAFGAMAAMSAMTVSLIHIARHWRYNRTKVRKPTVRLLFIVPIFAMDCWACLMLEASVYQWAELLTCIREVYVGRVWGVVVYRMGGEQAAMGVWFNQFRQLCCKRFPLADRKQRLY